MVYLTELLVVTTDCFKIVRIRARNVPRKRLDDDASLASLTPTKRRRLVTLVLDAP